MTVPRAAAAYGWQLKRITYIWHHVEFHGHGDNIKANDSRNCQVEVF